MPEKPDRSYEREVPASERKAFTTEYWCDDEKNILERRHTGSLIDPNTGRTLDPIPESERTKWSGGVKTCEEEEINYNYERLQKWEDVLERLKDID